MTRAAHLGASNDHSGSRLISGGTPMRVADLQVKDAQTIELGVQPA